jgi:hypothetical protein
MIFTFWAIYMGSQIRRQNDDFRPSGEALFDKSIRPISSFARVTIGSQIRRQNKELERSGLRFYDSILRL